MTRTAPGAGPAARLLPTLIMLIGLHSCALGCALLFAPRPVSRLFGFPEPASAFFPSQSGVFLLILGVCYLLALRERAFVKVIIVSKAFAVAFLVSHAAFLGTPPVVWLAAAGDASMLLAIVVTVRLAS